jgi:CelD/BcsL family acetyltransferase involved in cellulose biosynthesis
MSPLQIETLESTREFAALEEEWEDLYHNSPLATPFQSWAWLYSWWEFYGDGHELRLITVRGGDGLLVGLLPLMLERRGGFGKLLLVGTGLTDYLDVLVREGWEDAVSEAGVATVRRMGSWDLADLQQLRPEAAARVIFGRWPGRCVSVWQDGCPVLDLKPWDELLMTISKSYRKTARRALRRAEEDGVRRELVSLADAEEATRRLVSLHRELWKGRNIGSENLTRRFESHLVAAVSRMTARGLGGIFELWRDGQVIISQFWISGKDSVGLYINGASREAVERYQWSSLLMWHSLAITLGNKCSRLDLLRGEEPYKLQWAPEIIPNHRLILGRDWITWAPYSGYHVLHSKARWYVNSESAPRWVQSAAHGLRALRHGG